MPEMSWTEEEIYLLAERGYAFYQQGQYQEAGIIFSALVSLDPLNVYCRIALSALCMLLGDAQRAVNELSIVLQQNPAHHEARARRCEAYCALRNWKESQDDLEILRRNGQNQYIPRIAARLRAAGANAEMKVATSSARTR
jgi:tetratricopeptide (TPR) repeat protein